MKKTEKPLVAWSKSKQDSHRASQILLWAIIGVLALIKIYSEL